MILEVYYIIIVLCVSSSHPRLCSLYAQLLTGYPQHLGTSPAYLGTVQIIMTLPIQLTIVVMHQVKHSLTRICQLVSGFMLNFSRLFFEHVFKLASQFTICTVFFSHDIR